MIEVLNKTVDLAGIIQLAVAPVFLLAGIAGLLGMMTGRLGRIIDRLRIVEIELLNPQSQTMVPTFEKELQVLRRRVNINNRAIGFCTASALCVCLLVISLFAASFLGLPMKPVIAGLFVLSMLLLVISLLLFLREVQLATQTFRITRNYLNPE